MVRSDARPLRCHAIGEHLGRTPCDARHYSTVPPVMDVAFGARPHLLGVSGQMSRRTSRPSSTLTIAHKIARWRAVCGAREEAARPAPIATPKSPIANKARARDEFVPMRIPFSCRRVSHLNGIILRSPCWRCSACRGEWRRSKPSMRFITRSLQYFRRLSQNAR